MTLPALGAEGRSGASALLGLPGHDGWGAQGEAGARQSVQGPVVKCEVPSWCLSQCRDLGDILSGVMETCG